MRCSLLRCVQMVPMVVTMGAIFFLSHQPGDSLSLYPLPGIDKLAHAFIYGILGASIIFSYSSRMKKERAQHVVVMTVVLSCIYGMSDEFHQSFIPNRFVSFGDVVADVVGALLVGVCWYWISHRR